VSKERVTKVMIKLYSNRAPHGRCVVLAQRLSKVSDTVPGGCIQGAMDPFACLHPSEKPLAVELARPEFLGDLDAACHDHGIILERVDQ
jgi:hypothetical protein